MPLTQEWAVHAQLTIGPASAAARGLSMPPLSSAEGVRLECSWRPYGLQPPPAPEPPPQASNPLCQPHPAYGFQRGSILFTTSPPPRYSPTPTPHGAPASHGRQDSGYNSELSAAWAPPGATHSAAPVKRQPAPYGRRCKSTCSITLSAVPLQPPEPPPKPPPKPALQTPEPQQPPPVPPRACRDAASQTQATEESAPPSDCSASMTGSMGCSSPRQYARRHRTMPLPGTLAALRDSLPRGDANTCSDTDTDQVRPTPLRPATPRHCLLALFAPRTARRADVTSVGARDVTDTFLTSLSARCSTTTPLAHHDHFISPRPYGCCP